MTFEVANNYIFGFDGDHVWDWDGTSATKIVQVYQWGQWVRGFTIICSYRVKGYPNRVYWSNLGDPTTFNGANYVDINPGDGDKSISFGKIQDEMQILKRNTVWSITGFSGSSFSSTTIATQNTIIGS